MHTQTELANTLCAPLLQNRRNLEFRYKAKLNTSSGGYTQLVQMQKNMHQNTPSMVSRHMRACAARQLHCSHFLSQQRKQ